MHTDILKTTAFHLHWYDEGHTILLLNIFERWDWETAYLVIDKISAAAKSIDHDFYTVFWFHKANVMMPRTYVIPNVRNLMINTPNEQMIVLVNANRFLEIIVTTAAKGLPMFQKLRFTATLDRALEIIAQHKSALLRSSP